MSKDEDERITQRPRRLREPRSFRPIERTWRSASPQPQVIRPPQRAGQEPPQAPPARMYSFRAGMPAQEAAELILAATDDPRCAPAADVEAARNMLKAAWAARNGFEEVVGAGWSALIGGTGADTVGVAFPGDSGPVTLWAWMGSPFIRVVEPFATELTDEVHERMDGLARNCSLEYRVFTDEPGWRCHGRTVLVAWMLRENWRGRRWAPWAATL